MWLIYVPVLLLALIIAVKIFSFYERDVCTMLLCWMEALVERRTRKQLHISDIPADAGGLGIHKPRFR
jgi:hypothetical protein